MKVAELLAKRQHNWSELQYLCALVETKSRRKIPPELLTRMASLYRSACADLALADAYQLPPATVQYLHQLVANAHNQLYRSRSFNYRGWLRSLFVEVPQRLFYDNALRASFLLFFGLFILSYYMASNNRELAEMLVGEDFITMLEAMYASPPDGTGAFRGLAQTGFYIQHNATIGFRCFAMGVLLLGLGGLFEVSFNGIVLGGAFGYMASLQTSAKEHFFEFVTAHGPFELTAIVLSAAAGIRLGFSIVNTRGLTRLASLRLAGRETLPVMMAAAILFCLAAFIEGYISPSQLPYVAKACVGALSCLALMVYFVLLGMPMGPRPLPADALDAPAGSWEAALAADDD